MAIVEVLKILDVTYPTIPMHEVHGHDPFALLVAVILSQRSRDSVTVPTASKLFAVAKTPQEFVDMPVERLERLIRAVGFYHEKAVAIKKMSEMLIDDFGGQVPGTEKELLSLPHVGRKTANIILTTFFDTPQIAVDIHVHRITNRLGWVATAFPPHLTKEGTKGRFDSSSTAIQATEKELTKIIPRKYHSIVNRVFVAHGQTICLPRHPKCEVCPIEKYCAKVGV